jgi:peptide/nickel transport system substrate-binding protein
MSRIVGKLLALLTVVILIGACSPAAPTVAPTAAVKPTAAPAAAATSAPAVSAPAPTVVLPPVPPTPTAAAKVKRGGILKTTYVNDWGTLDPHIDQASIWASTLYGDALFGFELSDKTKRFEGTPELVESWKLLDDKTYQLNLRKSVKFHDGSTWNAEVLKWNLNRMATHPKSTTKANVGDVASVDVVDENTVKMNLKAPSAAVLLNLTAAADGRPLILSKVAVDTNGDASLHAKPVGTGPFQLVEWKTGDRIILKKFDNHWRMGADGQPKPYLDGVEERWIADGSVALLELRSGNLHLMPEILPKDIPALKSNAELVAREMPWMGQMRMMAFNQKSGPFSGDDKLKLRQAVAYAMDRESIVKSVGLGQGKPACYLLGDGQLGYDPSVPCYRYDAAKAKQLLGEAGFPNGTDVILSIIARLPDQPQGEALKSMLDAVGIRTTLDSIERLAWVNRTASCLHDFTPHASTFRIDADVAMSYRWLTGAPANYACMSIKAVDDCVQEARRTLDDSKRQEVYKRCQTIVHENAYYSPIWIWDRYDAHSKKLQGWRPYFQAVNFWADLWLE